MTAEHERYEALMMAAVDGVLDEQQQRRWQRHLASCAACQQEYNDFRHIKQVTDAMTTRIRCHADIQPPRLSAFGRGWLGGSMLLLAVGVLLLLAVGVWAVWHDPSTLQAERLGLLLLGGGGLGLLLYVLRARWRAGTRDRYQEIDQ